MVIILDKFEQFGWEFKISWDPSRNDGWVEAFGKVQENDTERQQVYSHWKHGDKKLTIEKAYSEVCEKIDVLNKKFGEVRLAIETLRNKVKELRESSNHSTGSEQ